MAWYWITIAWLLVVAVNVCAVVMRVRVNRTLPESERFSGWRRDAGAVSRRYRELFPNSYLPDLERYSFWLVVVMLLVWLIDALWKTN